MSEYVSRVRLEINGQSIEDFNSVEEGDRELAKPVKLMNSTGYVACTPRNTCSVEYVVPAESAEFDFASVVGGTLTIDYQNGKRVTYQGVTTTKIGQTKFDGEKEAIRKIDFSATNRVEE